MSFIKKIMLLPLLPAVVACTTVDPYAELDYGQLTREQLTASIEDARDTQTAVRAQFDATLDQFVTLVSADRNNWQTAFDQLKAEYAANQAQAAIIRSLIEDVESHSADLFNEWESELALFQDQNLRFKRELDLQEARRQCGQLLLSLHATENRMIPVLSAFRDYLVFLQDNLDARTVASLQPELAAMAGNIADLFYNIDSTIVESDEFLAELARI